MIEFFPRSRIFIDEIRPAEAETLVDVHADAFAQAWSAEDFAALMANDNVMSLAIRRDPVFGARRLAGFALLRSAADEAEVLTIAIRRSSQGRGYGRLLMEEALRRLYRDRIATCFLEVDRGNEPALGLYRALGFEVVGTRKGYYRNAADAEGSALVMRLQLR